MSKSKSGFGIFLNDAAVLRTLPLKSRYARLSLYEYPYDHLLLSHSRIYRESRKSYLDLGGQFFPRISSTMRSLSAQDLFANEIDYTPSATELDWFTKHHKELFDPGEEIVALSRFNVISVFHEQNHRVVWKLLPPAPSDQHDIRRYLNFAESLVVMLDLALGDELGMKLSLALERMRIIYREGRNSRGRSLSKSKYRDYLKVLAVSTYFVLELVNPEDILAAVDYVFPGQKSMNREAVQRSLGIGELFTRVTNPQWQERYWKDARKKLKSIHAKSPEDSLYLPEDPLDLDEEAFAIVGRVIDHFGL